MIIKLAATVFAFYAWSRVFSRYRKHTASKKELLFWSLIWIGIITVVFIPNKTNAIAHLIGMGRGFDALVFLSMIAVFFALYKMTAKLKQVERELTQLVRELALAAGRADASEQE